MSEVLKGKQSVLKGDFVDVPMSFWAQLRETLYNLQYEGECDCCRKEVLVVSELLREMKRLEQPNHE